MNVGLNETNKMNRYTCTILVFCTFYYSFTILIYLLCIIMMWNKQNSVSESVAPIEDKFYTKLFFGNSINKLSLFTSTLTYCQNLFADKLTYKRKGFYETARYKVPLQKNSPDWRTNRPQFIYVMYSLYKPYLLWHWGKYDTIGVLVGIEACMNVIVRNLEFCWQYKIGNRIWNAY